MTVQECVLDLLQFIGVTGFSATSGANALNRPGLDDLDTQKALQALNSALQTIQRYGPASLRQREVAVFLSAPTTLSVAVDVTSSAQSATFATAPPASVLGCSILIPGDSDLNRIMDITGSQVSLLRGYRGTTATGLLATVYADCAALPEDVKTVIDPVMVTPNRKLTRASSYEEFMRFTQHGWSRTHFWTTIEPGLGPSKVSGVPALYFVERRETGDLFIRFNPMPSAAVNASFNAEIRAERFDTTALAVDGSEDPGTEFTSVPEDEQESILLPIARWRFASHPALKNMETRNTLKAEYDTVMRQLANGQALEPSIGGQRVRYI